jgi:hypothetical protein
MEEGADAIPESRSGEPMRAALSGLLAALAVVLLPVALVALWVSVMLTRTDAFVDEVRPLISTPAVQQALTEAVVDGVLEQLDLAPAVQKVVEPPIREGAARAIASPQMTTVWATSMTALHREFVAVMEGRAATVDQQGRVVIAVPIALPALAATLASFGVPVTGDLTPVATIPVAPVEDVQKARVAYAVLDTVGPWGYIVVIALGVLAVVLAGSRRRTASLIATGWAVGAIGLGLALVAARQPLIDEVADPTVRTLANTAYGMAQRALLTEIGVVLGIVLLLLVVLGVMRGRRRVA